MTEFRLRFTPQPHSRLTAPGRPRFAALALLPLVALACTCGDIPLERELSRADLVFAATVIGCSAYSYEFDTENLIDEYAWKTVPISSWKGAHPDTLIVTSASSSDACGYKFEIGKSYLIFAIGGTSLSRRTPWVGLCSRTRRLEGAKDILAELGEPNWTRDDPDD